MLIPLLTVIVILFLVAVSVLFKFADWIIALDEWYVDYRAQRHYVAQIASSSQEAERNTVPPLSDAVEPVSEPTGTDQVEPTGTDTQRDIIELSRVEFVAELARVMIPNKNGVMAYLPYDVIANAANMRKADAAIIIRKVRGVEKKETPEPYQFEHVSNGRFKRIDIKE